MGTPDFAVPSLAALAQGPHEIITVVTSPDAARGRGLAVQPTPVKVFAQSRNLPILQPDDLKSSSFRDEIAALSPDLLVVVAFRILPLELIRVPRYGAINLHASLLPKYRGAAPVQRAIAAGETQTGLTVFLLAGIVDGGDIIARESVSIGPDETAGELLEKMKPIGADLLVRSVNDIASKTSKPIVQDSSAACPAPKLKKEEGLIHFALTAKEIYNRIRAFTPVPGAYALFKGRRVQIVKAALPDVSDKAAPGSIVYSDAAALRVTAGDGGCVDFLLLKPEGKKVMAARDFANGFRIQLHDKFSN